MAQSIRSSGARTSSASVEVQQGNVPNGHAYTRTIHHDEIGRAIAEQWLVHGADHALFAAGVDNWAESTHDEPAGVK